ncbi:hypothetical protein ACFV7R_38595 [Streptomyces sp. NPDC059866]|uniref:hypothetical protein n=1 Tax=Streptomyces sp. NPDC059866 TaxID=3346978 RepID=UPI003662D847
MDKLWEAAGTKLADRWAAVSGPALVFWIGGLLAYAHDRHGVRPLTDWLARQKSPVQLLAVALALVVVAASALAVQQFVTPTLRLLEGYWPRWLGFLRKRLIARLHAKDKADKAEWQQLEPLVTPPGATPDAETLRRYAEIDRRRQLRPFKSAALMPTRVGNVLHAAESRPGAKYGLDAVTVWPRLWLLLPETTRKELEAARRALDRGVATSLWGLLFLVFSPWSLWAVPIGLATAAGAVLLITPSRAEVYGQLVEAAFDVHRTVLYEHLRWPLPEHPRDELAQGAKLTSYLSGGSDAVHPRFVPPPPVEPR